MFRQCLVGVAAMVLTFQSAMAVSYQTGFEVADGWPMANPHTVITGSSIDGWDILRYGTANLYIESWRVHSGQAIYLEMNTQDSVELTRSFTESADHKTKLDFWATTVERGPLQFRIMNGSNADIAQLNIWNGKIYSDLYGTQTGATYTLGQWVHIVMELDTAAGNYDLYIYTDPLNMNPTVTITDEPLLESGAASKMHIGTNWTPTGFSYGCVDDLKLVPVNIENCGDEGTVYLMSDLDKDCKVDFEDFAEFAKQWLFCTDPARAECDVFWR